MYTLTNKTREICRASWEAQCFQAKLRVWQLWPSYFFGTIQQRSCVSKHQQTQATSISRKHNKNQPKQDAVLRHSTRV